LHGQFVQHLRSSYFLVVSYSRKNPPTHRGTRENLGDTIEVAGKTGVLERKSDNIRETLIEEKLLYYSLLGISYEKL